MSLLMLTTGFASSYNPLEEGKGQLLQCEGRNRETGEIMYI